MGHCELEKASDISRGIVATDLKGGGIFINEFSTSDSCILK